MKKKALIIALALMLISVMALSAGCGGGEQKDYSGIQSEVAIGRRAVVINDVLFFGYGNLLCTAKFQEGSASEFFIEGGFTGDIYALTVYGNDLYVSASDGIFKYSLDMFSGSGTGSASTVMDTNLSEYNQFQIYDDKLFCIYGDTLCCVPVAGGDATPLADEAADFEVTSEGIFYTDKDGNLHVIGTDLSGNEVLAELAPGCPLYVGNGKLYFRKFSDLSAYSLDKKKVEDIATGQKLDDSCYPWTNGTNVLYDDNSWTLHLVTPDGETDLETDYNYPLKPYGSVYGNYLVSLNGAGDELKIVDLTSGVIRNYDTAAELGSQLSQLSSNDQGGGDTTDGTPQTGSYDIFAGFQVETNGSAMYLYGNDFLLTMPNTDDWEYTQNGPDSFSIYMTEPRTEGFGGHLVTIKAYDLNDTSYEEIPYYHVAGVGQNVNKRFIAIYPTDVQFDSANSGQAARYRELLEYLEKIGEGAVNSPFQTADSD